MGDTEISWTDKTWNPIRGCSRVSAGCMNCYAERIAARFSDPGQPYHGLAKRVDRKVRQLKVVNGEATGDVHTVFRTEARWTGEVRFINERLMDPIRWRKPRRIFTDSMSDLFYKGVETWMIDKIVAVMMISCLHERRGGHVFQTLTKRADRLLAYFADPTTQERVARAAATMMEDGDGWYDEIAFRPEGLVHPYMWWGVSIENQEAADERIPDLLRTPAAVRFLSCEPLIGEVRLHEWTCREHGLAQIGAPRGLHWVIAGCESGPGARPCDDRWLADLRDQCEHAGVAFFLKQAVEGFYVHCGTGSKRKPGGVIELPYLDGVQHAAFPEARDESDQS